MKICEDGTIQLLPTQVVCGKVMLSLLLSVYLSGGRGITMLTHLELFKRVQLGNLMPPQPPDLLANGRLAFD